MTETVRVRLQPLGRTITLERGAALRDALFAHGVEFPCGGRGDCRRCRVKLREGFLASTPRDRALLSAQQRKEGWRLACCSRVHEDVTLEVEQLSIPILADASHFDFQPRPGFAVAVDVGTTTLVAQLVDLQSGTVLASASAINPQAAHGSDIMTRVRFALDAGGRRLLTALVRGATGDLLRRLLADARLPPERLETVVAVGNTVMYHLFCGLDVSGLASLPFQPKDRGLRTLPGEELGWAMDANPPVRFLPCLGGFVGSDVLAGILATRMLERDELTALVDLGTNGEIVVGNADGMLCASAAAGPAFEAGGIAMGMRAASGAIDQVRASDDGRLRCRVLGGGRARGICGSGVVDAIAAGLDLGWIDSSGRLARDRKVLALGESVQLTQRDVRQLQLAKGAIAAGLRLLLEQRHTPPEAPARIYLAGAFGNYVDCRSAARIGLLQAAGNRLQPAGNTALLGAKLALFETDPQALEFRDLRRLIEHVSLAASPGFHEAFIAETAFPD